MTQGNVKPAAARQDHLNRWCALPTLYPEIRVQRPNRYYAELLLEDYAGQVSEMTAINQYFYHHVVFKEKYADLAALEECISIIEMWHLEMLAETILLLGVDPRIRTLTGNQTVYWNANYVYYGNSVCDRLAADIAAEKSAIVQYRKHRDLINDPYIDAILERIIMDEQHHLRLFTEAMDKYCR
ncbi:ferritin-like domain-containing protein [Desulfoscipio geothermicus]|uniref:Bacterioferritin n=1 Tax=Desulfoscipio geothermicus DSM 3669 TaxID=1121426 RepID=A0A1I6CNI9_9FIRM|nr:manganese catalase family protein [Desulfoscipio geothermicus]SFQ94713.1 bacterioferritin [Desulfoscipio geothermicus DSM 3669]